MSDDAKQPEPDEDLLEFLGGIDEANEESEDGDFADFLAKASFDRVADPGQKPQAPPPKDEQKHE